MSVDIVRTVRAALISYNRNGTTGAADMNKLRCIDSLGCLPKPDLLQSVGTSTWCFIEATCELCIMNDQSDCTCKLPQQVQQGGTSSLGQGLESLEDPFACAIRVSACLWLIQLHDLSRFESKAEDASFERPHLIL